MGYAYYEIGGMKRGYSVACKCHVRGCKERIDRGMAYLCYACAQYFCYRHLTSAWSEDDEPIKAECFAGSSSQVCHACAKTLEAWDADLKKQLNAENI